MPDSKAQSESASEVKGKREPREPRALSTEYHKARKQLMLWAGILFIWELVGIDLEKAKEAGGNAGAIIRAIRSPQAIPWVLLILVGYFLFKLTVEWYQCNVHRRALRVARVDYFSAWIVSVLAYALYIYQAISRAQFADLLQGSNKTASVVVGGFLGFWLGTLFVRYWNFRGKNFDKFDYVHSFAVGAIALGIIIGGYIGYLNVLFSIMGVVVTTLLMFGANVVVRISRYGFSIEALFKVLEH